MIKVFFVLNVIIFLCTSLGIIMFSNNLKRISKSIDIYLDPKAYKPESEVKLISLLVDKYQGYKKKELVDLDSLIKDGFYNNKIGKFKVTIVETLANKGKRLLWLSIITMVLFESMTIGLGQSINHSIGIIINLGLGVILAFFEMYKNIDMGKQRLFFKIKDHLNNEYPQFRANKKEKEEISLLLNKINQLESEIRKYEKIEFNERQEKRIQENRLQEEDIAEILECFDGFQI